jgi:dolichol-phosphate mannosyltransferase
MSLAVIVPLVGCGVGMVSWGVIFVDDDSSDGTAERIREIGGRDRRVRCLQRVGELRLATLGRTT